MDVYMSQLTVNPWYNDTDHKTHPFFSFQDRSIYLSIYISI